MLPQMESILAGQSYRKTTMSDDPSLRLEKRPPSSSEPNSQEPKSRSQPKLTDLSQTPGKGQWFDDLGSSFPSKPNKPSQTRKPKPSRVDNNSDSDEIDFLSQKSDQYDSGGSHREVKSMSKGKDKDKETLRGVESDSDFIEVDGHGVLPMHPNHKPRKKKLPKINKVKTPATDDNYVSQASLQSKPKSKSSNATSSTHCKPCSSSTSVKDDSAQTKRPRPKPKPNPIAFTSRSEPLHTRSANEPPPRNDSSKPRPRPRPAPLKTADTSPLDTNIESPAKAPQGTKTSAASSMGDLTPVAGRRVQKGSIFPLTPPARKPTRTDTFPSMPSLSTNNINHVDDGSDDELGFDENDEIINRGGLRPFPMATQELRSIGKSNYGKYDDDLYLSLFTRILSRDVNCTSQEYGAL